MKGNILYVFQVFLYIIIFFFLIELNEKVMNKQEVDEKE